ERKEESRIKKNEKDDDDYETIVDEEDSEKEKDTKEPNRKEHADIEDTTGTSEGRKNGIG
ncbi:5669_t:CDS:2, partial [Gigaspora rosea]